MLSEVKWTFQFFSTSKVVTRAIASWINSAFILHCDKFLELSATFTGKDKSRSWHLGGWHYDNISSIPTHFLYSGLLRHPTMYLEVWDEISVIGKSLNHLPCTNYVQLCKIWLVIMTVQLFHLQIFPYTDVLLDTECVGSGVYRPDLDEPEYCNAHNSHILYELHLLLVSGIDRLMIAIFC